MFVIETILPEQILKEALCFTGAIKGKETGARVAAHGEPVIESPVLVGSGSKANVFEPFVDTSVAWVKVIFVWRLPVQILQNVFKKEPIVI